MAHLFKRQKVLLVDCKKCNRKKSKREQKTKDERGSEDERHVKERNRIEEGKKEERGETKRGRREGEEKEDILVEKDSLIIAETNHRPR